MGEWLENNWFAFVLLALIGIAIGVAVYEIKKKKEREQQIQLEEDILKEDGFNIDKKVTDINKKYSIFIDDKNKKFALYNTKTDIQKVISYEDLVSFELKEDHNSVVSGRAGSAIVGGLLFGGLGAIAGASGSRKVTESSCNSMILYIVINDMSDPNIEIPLIEKETRKNSDEYEDAIKKAQEIVSAFKVILEQNKNPSKEKTNSKNATQELREYKQLLDDGIITEEEFNKKKKEILDNKE